MRRLPPLVVLAFLGGSCSREPAASQGVLLVGSPAAVAGLPRYRSPARFLVEGCCSFLLEDGARPVRGEGIDSTVYDVTGSGYVLHLAFGPYDVPEAAPDYDPVSERVIDGVKVGQFRWHSPTREPPPDGPLLWVARVGGGNIGGVRHTPWGLRIMGRCQGEAACRNASNLVWSVRF